MTGTTGILPDLDPTWAATIMARTDTAKDAMGVEIVELERGRAVLAMTVRDEMANGFGITHGGFVFARGAGALDDPRSGLHRRDRYGVERLGTYHSVDTGKYSTAPWLARELAAEIAG